MYNKYSQNKGREIADRIKAEDWYKEELKKSNTEFLNWLIERKSNVPQIKGYLLRKPKRAD